ncbi:hypothetical protein L195_g052768, partial [Trifolium pratense]
SCAVAQLPAQDPIPRCSSCAMRSSSAPWRSLQGSNLPFQALIAPYATSLRHGADPREKFFPNHSSLRHAQSCGAMAQVSEKFLPVQLSFAPCAVLLCHGAAYKGLELPILAQLRHAQHSCAMAQPEFKFSLFYLRITQPSIRLLFHSL